MGKKQNKTSIGKVWQWCNPCALMMGVENGKQFLRVIIKLEYNFLIPLLILYLKKIKQRPFFIHSNIIQNSQKLEALHVAINK
jgi:hypothetical protein